MIKKVLTYCADQLNGYLSRYHHRPEGLAEVGHIGQSTGETPNKIIVSLVNLERETAGGIAANVRTANGGYTSSAAPFLLNLKVMFAAVFEEKQYAESLSIFSTALAFIQSNHRFRIDDVEYSLTLETVPIFDFHNIWATAVRLIIILPPAATVMENNRIITA
ncbi:MAG: DUF4255 domain-containing protein [Bacteroidales bacterium]|nr:DUF4255 domain-containing protein [Bacteroidaceae bacterium]MBP3661922.1 DUF4255 domain-containing protein [Bacteroidales bacterium]